LEFALQKNFYQYENRKETSMADNFLVKLFEHNNWANQKIFEACATLSDEQLDAAPRSVTKGTIRRTLEHLVNSQRGYLALLAMPVEVRRQAATAVIGITDLQESARVSGEGLLALAKGDRKPFHSRLETTDGFYTEPWVVMLQVINHATEHREQIKSMLSDLGITPPSIDGWDYGEVTEALIPISK
jgi:uncharacterized damage-inducible protein DinB